MTDHEGPAPWPLWHAHDDIPVLDYGDVWFLYDDPIIGPILPLMFITVPVEEDGVMGRDRIDCYPFVQQCELIPPLGIGQASRTSLGVPFYDAGIDDSAVCDKADQSDPYGDDALHYGGMYYEEGMGYTAPKDHGRRLDCFKAAEILYRHSAGRGNPFGWLCLGYVYAYDRCEGRYFRSYYDNFGEAAPKPDTDVMALEAFRHAAEADIAEGCYKYGDMLDEGRGCEPDYAGALTMFRRAFDLGKDERPHIWGSAALRIARAYADAKGCRHDCAEALHWYEIARTGLELAVRDGAGAYDARLWEAEAGVMDMQQELRLG
ncbi:sel1 repeat family protein [Bifidobacterium sp. 82T24]|uniref:tetratricopeptide repeat protein n=1 Tax=Bifidobacterium pluvialisilvae TaxID=2834436 RepID=UPI001C56D5D6|nr:hypothetical protein [Bifidobacterium pluvialisilvae]MBW3089072.1 sel1 repeat family protein [Bifidobacterium pluvialisilvae]